MSITTPYNDSTKAVNGPGKKDTASAVVAYGCDYLFTPHDFVSSHSFTELMDSLLSNDTISEGLKKDLKFLKEVQNLSLDKIYSTIDSLFDLEEVPYALINQINLYTSMYEEMDKIDDHDMAQTYSLPIDDGSGLPANQIYDSIWKNTVPFDYPPALSANDSTSVLILEDSASNFTYSHPIGQKTLLRYYGIVTSNFGWRNGRSHNGVDLECHYWDSLYCMFPGKVRMARNYGGYGRVVIVRHDNGLESLYAHMSKIRVKEGQRVESGQLLGHGGQTGNATGVHLHLEIRYKGVPLNPAHIISFSKRQPFGDTLVIKKTHRSYIAYPYGTEIHIVERGEYPYKIAKRYGITITELCEANNLHSRSRLMVGQKLRIPN